MAEFLVNHIPADFLTNFLINTPSTLSVIHFIYKHTRSSMQSITQGFLCSFNFCWRFLTGFILRFARIHTNLLQTLKVKSEERLYKIEGSGCLM